MYFRRYGYFQALCKNCGFVSQDFNCCVRCKKSIGENCKTVVDPTFKGDDDSKQGGGQSKADLRTVRIQALFPIKFFISYKQLILIG